MAANISSAHNDTPAQIKLGKPASGPNKTHEHCLDYGTSPSAKGASLDNNDVKKGYRLQGIPATEANNSGSTNANQAPRPEATASGSPSLSLDRKRTAPDQPTARVQKTPLLTPPSVTATEDENLPDADWKPPGTTVKPPQERNYGDSPNPCRDTNDDNKAGNPTPTSLTSNSTATTLGQSRRLNLIATDALRANAPSKKIHR